MTSMRKQRVFRAGFKNILIILLMVFALYLFVSLTIYRFKNPSKTETELFLEIPKALKLE